MPTSIHIDGLEFYGHHGVTDAEQEIGHRYILDLVLEVEETASRSDEIEDTVDYGQVMDIAVSVGVDSQFRTVERLALVICDEIMRRCKPVDAVEIYIRKMAPPAPFIVSEVGVHMRRERPPRRAER